MTDRDSKPPESVRVVNAIFHGLMSVSVWWIAYAVWESGQLRPEVTFGAALAVTGLGGFQLRRGQPPMNALVSGGTAALQALRHLKGSAVLAVLAGSMLVSGCGAFDDPGQTARDVTEHPVFRGTLGGLLGACAATQGAHTTWDAVCDGAQQVDAVRGLLQSGAGPAELPPEVAGRECVAFEDGRVECES